MTLCSSGNSCFNLTQLLETDIFFSRAFVDTSWNSNHCVDWISFSKENSNCMLLLEPFNFLREVNDKLSSGGLIGYGELCLEYWFCYFNFIRQHAKVHNPAGWFQSQTSQRPSNCNKISGDQTHASLFMWANYCFFPWRKPLVFLLHFCRLLKQ